MRFHVTFDENARLNDINAIANVEYNEVHDAELERHFAQNKVLYNKRVLHVSNVLKSEAIKREMVQDKEPDLNIGSVVKLKTYVTTNQDEVQGVIIKIGETQIQNPIRYKKQTRKEDLDTAAIKRSQVAKVDLKTKKFYKKMYSWSRANSKTPKTVNVTH